MEDDPPGAACTRVLGLFRYRGLSQLSTEGSNDVVFAVVDVQQARGVHSTSQKPSNSLTSLPTELTVETVSLVSRGIQEHPTVSVYFGQKLYGYPCSCRTSFSEPIVLCVLIARLMQEAHS